MITIDDIVETNRMITENKLDVRTITMGISLRDCAHPNIQQFCRNVYDKITTSAGSARRPVKRRCLYNRMKF